MSVPVPAAGGASRSPAFAEHLRPEVRAVAPLCASADAYAQARGVDAYDRNALRIVLEALLTNVAKHASARGDVGVRVEAVHDAIRIRIDDDGIAFDPTAAHGPRITSLVETATVGGMGLQLVRSAVRAFRYRREAGRNVVEAEIALLEPLGKGV